MATDLWLGPLEGSWWWRGICNQPGHWNLISKQCLYFMNVDQGYRTKNISLDTQVWLFKFLGILIVYSIVMVKTIVLILIMSVENLIEGFSLINIYRKLSQFHKCEIAFNRKMIYWKTQFSVTKLWTFVKKFVNELFGMSHVIPK